MCFQASTDDMLYDPRSTLSASKAWAGVISWGRWLRPFIEFHRRQKWRFPERRVPLNHPF